MMAELSFKSFFRIFFYYFLYSLGFYNASKHGPEPLFLNKFFKKR